MTDNRKLLESAAKACGIDGKYNAVTEEFYLSEGEVDPSGKGREWWNPLIDSADCAAMCAKLGIDTAWWSENVACGNSALGEVLNVDFADYNNDREAAWRYAATQVAAAIGDSK